MNDPQDYLPGYTITLIAYEDYYKTFAAEHFDRERYWDGLYDIWGLVYPYDTSSTVYPYFTNHLPDANTDDFYRLLYEYDYSGYGYYQFLPGWDDVNCWGTGESPWDYYSYNCYTYRSYYRDPDWLEAC